MEDDYLVGVGVCASGYIDDEEENWAEKGVSERIQVKESAADHGMHICILSSSHGAGKNHMPTM